MASLLAMLRLRGGGGSQVEWCVGHRPDGISARYDTGPFPPESPAENFDPAVAF